MLIAVGKIFIKLIGKYYWSTFSFIVKESGVGYFMRVAKAELWPLRIIENQFFVLLIEVGYLKLISRMRYGELSITILFVANPYWKGTVIKVPFLMTMVLLAPFFSTSYSLMPKSNLTTASLASFKLFHIILSPSTSREFSIMNS